MLLDFSLDEALALHRVALPAKDFRDDYQFDRFSLKNFDSSDSFESLVLDDAFDSGSIFWYSGLLEAMIASKVFFGSGYRAVVLVDGEGGVDKGFAVLTSYDFRSQFRVEDDQLIKAELVVHLPVHDDEAVDVTTVPFLVELADACGGEVRLDSRPGVPSGVVMVVEGSWDELHELVGLVEKTLNCRVDIFPVKW